MRSATVEREDVERITKGLMMGNFSPDFVEHVVQIQVKNRTYFKAILKQGCFQTGIPDAHPEAWPYRGYHCTDNPGIVGILKDRSFKLGGFNGIYASLVQNPKNENESCRLMEKCFRGKKDLAGVIIDVKLVCRSKSHTSGGVAQNMETCAQGFVSHMKPDARWLMPMERITISALIFSNRSFEDLENTVFASLT
jgi:hypothetical protein